VAEELNFEIASQRALTAMQVPHKITLSVDPLRKLGIDVGHVIGSTALHALSYLIFG
jgi:hypothetical protein